MKNKCNDSDPCSQLITAAEFLSWCQLGCQSQHKNLPKEDCDQCCMSLVGKAFPTKET